MAIRRFVVFLLAAAFLAGFQDAGEIDRWIADLINADPAVRAQAEQSLIKAGSKALPAIKLACDSKTPELAARAKFVASEIERLEFEKKRDAEQRPRRLEIVSLSLKDGALSEALKILGGQVDSTFHSEIDKKQKLTIEVKDVPLRKCLDQMEDALKATIVSRYNWHRVSKGAATRKTRAYIPGATFEFRLLKFVKDGQPAGWCLTTDQTGPATVFIDSIEALDAQKAAVEVERCGRCSPQFTHLKTDKAAPFTIRVKGRLVWESPYEFPVTEISKGQDFRVGPFAGHYEWQKVTWTAAEPVPQQLIGRAELVGKLKKQFQPPGGTGPMGVQVVPPPSRFEGSWCACAKNPVPVTPTKPIMVTSGSHYESAFQTRKPDQFDSMKIRFYKGIEEPFEAEAVVPAD